MFCFLFYLFLLTDVKMNIRKRKEHEKNTEKEKEQKERKKERKKEQETGFVWVLFIQFDNMQQRSP
jgi:hypothetical protein